jgi:hypothetical protein
MNDNYKFPIDNKNTPYAAKIKFTAREIESFDVNFLFDIADISLKTANEQSQKKDQAYGDENGFHFGPIDDGTKKKEFKQRVTTANNGPPGTAPSGIQNATGQSFKGGPKGSATLYLPQAVQITDGAAYSNVDLGILGAGAQAAMQEGASLLPSIVTGIGDTAASIIDAIGNRSSGSKDLARLAVNRAAKFIPSDTARGAVSSATRVAINPNTRALFKSVPLREFTFTFKLIPTSKDETQAIKDIIKFFRSNLYPEVIEMAGINAGYKFPNVFQIELKYDNKKERLATRILPSYIRSFSATYNASGMGFLEGGDFTEVDITMSFIESGTLHKDLVQNKEY